MVPGTGRLEFVDRRDADHPFTVSLAVEPSTRTYRFWTPGAVLDQQQAPHAVAYAWKHLLQSSPHRQAARMNEAFVYGWCQLNDEWTTQDNIALHTGTSVRSGAKFMRGIGAIGEYVWAQSAAEMKDWVLEHGPVVAGTRWYENMFDPNAQGFVQPTGEKVGGHAYLITGYSARRHAFRGMNSWGESWGQRGKFWIDEDDMATLFANGGEACAPKEVLL